MSFADPCSTLRTLADGSSVRVCPKGLGEVLHVFLFIVMLGISSAQVLTKTRQGPTAVLAV